MSLVYVASGLVGLALGRNPATARTFALGFGAVYAVVTLWGFLDANDVLGLIPVNVLQLAIATAGILAGLASTTSRAPTTARTA